MASVQAVGELKGFAKFLGRITGIQLTLLVRKKTVPPLRRNTSSGIIRPSKFRTYGHIGLGVLGH